MGKMRERIMTIMAIALTVGSVFPYSLVGSADTIDVNEKASIIEAKILANGDEVSAKNQIQRGGEVTVELEWETIKGVKLATGATQVLPLPENLEYEEVAPEAGELGTAGTYTLDTVKKTLTLNFNSNTSINQKTKLEEYQQYQGKISLQATAGKVTPATTATEQVKFSENLVKTIVYLDDESEDADPEVPGDLKELQPEKPVEKTPTEPVFDQASLLREDPEDPDAVPRSITERPDADKYMKKDANQNLTIFDTAVLKRKNTSGVYEEVTLDNPMQVGDDIEMTFDWSFDNNFKANLKKGDFFQFKLPEFLTIDVPKDHDPNEPVMKGPVANSKNVPYGSYQVMANGEVTFSFDQDIFFTDFNIYGWFKVAGKAEAFDTGKDQDKVVDFVDDFPGVLPPVQIKNKKVLAKSVNATNITYKQDSKIQWTLDVNQARGSVPAGSILRDPLPEGLSYVKDSFIIEAYQLNDQGEPINSDPIDLKPGVDYRLTVADGVLEVEFLKTTTHYYQIKFKTSIDDIVGLMSTPSKTLAPAFTDKFSASFTNTATLTRPGYKDLKASASTKVVLTGTISKSLTEYDEKTNLASYSVKMKLNESESATPEEKEMIPKGTRIRDWMNFGQLIVDQKGNTHTEKIGEEVTSHIEFMPSNPGIKVYFIGNIGGSNNYDFVFEKDVYQTFTMNYRTKVDQSKIDSSTIDANTTIWNQVKWISNKTGSHKIPHENAGVVKDFLDGEKPNYEYESEVTWQTVINDQHKELDQWSIRDTMGSNLSIEDVTTDADIVTLYYQIPGGKWQPVHKDYYSLKQENYTSGGALNYRFYVFSNEKTYNEPQPNSGTVIPGNAAFKVVYTTKHDPGNIKDKTERFTNTIYFTYTIDGQKYSKSTNKYFDIQPHKAAIVSKGGQFKAATKAAELDRITWTFDVNKTNVHRFGTTDRFEDTFMFGTKYVQDSLKVYEVTQVADEEKLTDVTSQFQVDFTDKREVVNDNNVNEIRDMITVKGFEAGSTKHYRLVFEASITKEEHNGEWLTPDRIVTNIGRFYDRYDRELKANAAVDHAQTSDFIDKEGALKDEYVEFTVHVNRDAGENIPPKKRTLKQVRLTDSQTHLQLDTASVKVVDSQNNPYEHYELLAGDQGFTMTFTKDITEQLTVTYRSLLIEPSDLGNGNEYTPTNNVVLSGKNFLNKEKEYEFKAKVGSSSAYASGVVGKFNVVKTDATDETKPVAGAVFHLHHYDENTNKKGDYVDSSTTNEQGIATFTGLNSGFYYVYEDKPAPGYYLEGSVDDRGKVVELILGADGKTMEAVADQTFTNKQSGHLQLTKTDGEGQLLAGAVFELYHWDGTKMGAKVTKNAAEMTIGDEQGRFTTNATGQINIANLIPGWYVFKEVAAAPGYQIIGEGVSEPVEVKSNNDANSYLAQMTVTNEPLVGSIALYKHGRNEAGVDGPLAGATFTLYEVKNGQETAVGQPKTSNASGKVTFTDVLHFGKVYTIRETKNPSGYTGTVVYENIQMDGKGQITYGAKNQVYDENTPLDAGNEYDRSLEVSGEKTWQLKGNDQDFVMPEEIVVSLDRIDGAGNTKIGYQTKVVTAKDNWQYRFTNLPVYDTVNQGNYQYRISEKAVAGFQLTASDGRNLENTLLVKDIEGTKTWDPLAKTYELIPESITVNLMVAEKGSQDWQPFTRDGAAVSVTTDASKGWRYQFKDLPTFKNGQIPLVYQVVEVAVPGFTSEAGEGTYDLHNQLNVVEKAGKKTWDDAQDQDGLRPESITVQLLQNGEVMKGKAFTKEVTEKTGWQYRFTNLPEKDRQGVDYVYTVKEVNVPAGYQVSYDGMNIKNSHRPETTSFGGKKIWQDQQDRFKKRPDQIEVYLIDAKKRPTAAVGETDEQLQAKWAALEIPGTRQTVTAATDWTYQWQDMPVYQNGKKIHYQVIEVKVAGYGMHFMNEDATGNIILEGEGSFDITNRLDQIDSPFVLSGTKRWENDQDDTSSRQEITVYLVRGKDRASGVKVANSERVMTEKNNWGAFWQYRLSDFPDGTEVTDFWIVEETAVANYETRYEGNFTVINRHITGETEVKVTKQWQDQQNVDGLRPAAITLQLFANDEETPRQEVAVKGTGDTWQHRFTGLPKYEKGQLIDYKVKEVPVAGYTTTTKGNAADGFTITNRHVPQTTEIKAQKVWKDADDQDGLRPEKITLHLIADGNEEEPVATVAVTADAGWSYTFKDLPQNKAGKAITYTVKEEAVTGYTSGITGDAKKGFTITNTHEPELLAIQGQKIWDDADDQDGLRPESITVQLFANERLVQELTVTGSGDTWAYRFDALPKNERGQAIEYTVKEVAVAGYTTTIDGDMTAGFIITNSHTPAPTPPTRPRLPDTQGSQTTTTTTGRLTLPRTGSELLLWLPGLGLLLILAAILLYGWKRRRS